MVLSFPVQNFRSLLAERYGYCGHNHRPYNVLVIDGRFF
jgi:hypothetical protein